MTPTGSKRKARFFWQGMLILLPVVVMAGIALAALVQDRAAAEQEARRRAEEVLREVAAEFASTMGTELSQVSVGASGFYGELWSKRHLLAAALWPGGAPRRQLEQELDSSPAVSMGAESTFELLARETGLPPEQMVLAGLTFGPEGTVADPPEAAREAQPPGWRLGLTRAQTEALEALERLDPASRDTAAVEQAVKRWQDTTPPKAALANAEFLRLRVGLEREPAAAAVRQWLQFAEQVRDERSGAVQLSESGVPLSSLAVAKALQRAQETGPTEPLWQALTAEVEQQPNSLIPTLLELAEPLTTQRPELGPCLEALRWRWEATQRSWEVAEVIRQSGRLQGITTTNFWLEFQGVRWLCLLQPSESWKQPAVRPASTEARLCSKAALEQALRNVVVNRLGSLPAYLRFSAELEGERLEDGGKEPASETLARTEGRLTCPESVEVGSGAPAVNYESMPGQPRYLLRVELVNRPLMFAAQRRRTLVFGSLVLAAALTAAVGFGTAYRSFQRQLRLSEMKSNFVSSVSHELRAPIASVRLMAESLERGKVAEPARQREYFRFIGQECRRLSSLIENVLDFSRIEQNRKQYEFEPTDIVELTRQTVRLMETYAEEKGVALRLQIPQEVSSLESKVSSSALQPVLDGKAIQQALVNLIDNALKHSPKGEQVLVGLEMPAPPDPATRNTQHALRLSLWVQDHGPGIPAAEHERIFERFYRLGSELRRETQGVGIGLSIVKHVVEAHGGQVQVQSAPGQGSRFTLELPMHQP